MRCHVRRAVSWLVWTRGMLLIKLDTILDRVRSSTWSRLRCFPRHSTLAHLTSYTVMVSYTTRIPHAPHSLRLLGFPNTTTACFMSGCIHTTKSERHYCVAC